MKPQELYKGIKVVVTNHPDATVYTVKSVKNFTAELVYITRNGQKVFGGLVDASLLKLPTIQQLANA
jgi:hypothetical protein